MSNKKLYEIGGQAWNMRDTADFHQRLHDCVDAVAAAVRAENNETLQSIWLRATLAEADGVNMRGALRNIIEQIGAALAKQEPTK